MMKAIKNFMNEPFTWGGYFRLCGIVTGLYEQSLVCASHGMTTRSERKFLKQRKRTKTEDKI